jgi:Phage integrase family
MERCRFGRAKDHGQANVVARPGRRTEDSGLSSADTDALTTPWGHAALALETPYAGESDWVFASFKLRGKQPREGNMIGADYLRPAAVRAGVLAEGDKRRFGWHNFRHSLASFLVASGTDTKTVQELLRHSKVQTTLDLYSQSMPAERMVAQGSMLNAIFSQNLPVEKPITGGSRVWRNAPEPYLIEDYGRHEETRTPDLYRVKGKLTCISNDFEGLLDRVSTSKYLQGGPITGVDHGCEILGTFGAE